MHQPFARKLFVYGVLFSLLFTGMPARSGASSRLLKGPMVPLESQTTLSSKTAHVGDAFEGVLTAPYCRKSNCLPVGTQFTGIVTKVKHAHRFHRPGVLRLQLQAIHIPNEAPVALDPNFAKTRLTVIKDSGATTWSYALKKQLPGLIGGATFPYILTQTTTLGPKRIITATLALGVLADIAQEVIWPTFQGTSVPKRVVLGVLGTFYIPDIIDVFHKQPDATLTQGKPFKLRLPPHTFQQIAKESQPEPTPAAIDIDHLQGVELPEVSNSFN